MRAWENTKSQGCIETEQLSSERDPELEIQCVLWWLTKSHSLFRNSSLSQHHIVLLVGVYTQDESCFWAEAWDYSCLDIHCVLILEIFYFYFCVCVWFCVPVYRSPWEPELWHWIPWNVEVGAWKVCLKHCLPRDLHPPAWSHSLRAPKALKTETPIRKWAFKPWHREYCRCHQMHMIMFPFGRTTRDLSLMTEPCEWETIRGRCWNVSLCDC